MLCQEMTKNNQHVIPRYHHPGHVPNAAVYNNYSTGQFNYAAHFESSPGETGSNACDDTYWNNHQL